MEYLEAEVAGLLNGESKVDPVPGIVDDEHQGPRWKRPSVKQTFKVTPRGVFREGMGGGKVDPVPGRGKAYNR